MSLPGARSSAPSPNRLGWASKRRRPVSLEVVDAAMVGAIRAVSTQRGIDPRQFVLVAGGGAGALHAARLARALSIEQVLIPRAAGTLCAFGMAVTDVRHDYSAPLHQRSGSLEVERVQELYAGLESQARAQVGETRELVLERSVDARYPGQAHEITITLSWPLSVDLLEAEFHTEHKRLFTYSRAELEIEFLHWRLTAVVPARVGAIEAAAAVPAPAEVGQRDIWLDGGWTPARVLRADSFEPGLQLAGPAVLEAATTTVLLDPRDAIEVTSAGALAVSIGQSAHALVGSVDRRRRKGRRALRRPVADWLAAARNGKRKRLTRRTRCSCTHSRPLRRTSTNTGLLCRYWERRARSGSWSRLVR